MTKYREISKAEVLTDIQNFKKVPGKRQIIFKGIGANDPIGDYLHYDPKLDIRPSIVAKTHGNSYNMLLNNLPSWILLPLRERSIIATTDVETAASFAAKGKFGKTFVLLTELDSPFVVSPTADIWYSFGKCIKELALPEEIGSLKQFNVCLGELAVGLGLANDFDNTWDTFWDGIIKISRNKMVGGAKLSKPARNLHKTLYSHSNHLLGFLDRIFSPDFNDFKLLTYSEVCESKLHKDNEVWTSSNCLFVEVSEYIKAVES